MAMLEQLEAALEEMLRAGGRQSPAAVAGCTSGIDGRTAFDQSICWAVEGGGKRVRPMICMMAAVAAGGRAEDALMPACAIELLHSYTLVHDDLPAMDNDTMRRGKPSVWAKFGEATAILAGDALQAMAFSAAARSPRNAAGIAAALAAAAEAVVRGQAADLAAAEVRESPHGFDGQASGESPHSFDGQAVLDLIADKTAALFVAAAEMGALAADAAPAAVESLKSYAYNLGFAFQYQDDLLDAGDGAFSSISVFGADDVRRRVVGHTAAATAALAGLPGDTSPLAALAERLVSRKV